MSAITNKTTNDEIEDKSTSVIADLVAFFRMAQDEIRELFYVASEEGWSEEQLISEIDSLFGEDESEEEVIQDEQNEIQ